MSVARRARRVGRDRKGEGKRRGARAGRTVDAGQAGERIDRGSVVGGDPREGLQLRAARLDAPAALGPRGHLADDESRTRERVASVSLGMCRRGRSVAFGFRRGRGRVRGRERRVRAARGVGVDAHGRSSASEG